MSRTPANSPLTFVRGSTWEDYFAYKVDGVAFDATGYEARMQVRTEDGQYGLTTAETLLLELSTTGDAPALYWDTAPDGILRLKVSAADTLLLNPANERRVRLFYALEVYLPAGAESEYVLPWAYGPVVGMGETTR